MGVCVEMHKLCCLLACVFVCLFVDVGGRNAGLNTDTTAIYCRYFSGHSHRC